MTRAFVQVFFDLLAEDVVVGFVDSLCCIDEGVGSDMAGHASVGPVVDRVGELFGAEVARRDGCGKENENGKSQRREQQFFDHVEISSYRRSVVDPKCHPHVAKCWRASKESFRRDSNFAEDLVPRTGEEQLRHVRQTSEQLRNDRFGLLVGWIGGPDAGGTAALAVAVFDEFAAEFDEFAVVAKEAFTEADATRILVVDEDGGIVERGTDAPAFDLIPEAL